MFVRTDGVNVDGLSHSYVYLIKIDSKLSVLHGSSNMQQNSQHTRSFLMYPRNKVCPQSTGTLGE